MLTKTEFLKEAHSAWNKLSGRFFKLEELQSFAEPGDPSFEAYRRGDRIAAARLIKSRVAKQGIMYGSALSRGVKLLRVRIVDLPITPYLSYEWPAYHVNATIGETILVPEPALISDLRHDRRMKDFLLFDDFLVLLLHYDSAGVFVGATPITDSERVQEYKEFSESLLPKSMPFTEFEKLHPELQEFVDA